MKKILSFKQLTTIFLASILLVACATKNERYTKTNFNKTQQGAIIGGMLGAVLGLATSNHKGKRGLVGGIVGATLGAAIGNSLDKQAREIAHEVGTKVDNSPQALINPNNDIIVSNTNNYVKIMLRNSMVFETNSSIPTLEASKKISKIAKVLNNYPNTIVQVVGFTDSRGSYEYNQKLSQERAKNVANTIHNDGVPNPIYSKGCSYNKPLVPNKTKEDMALNRRIEIYLYANQQSIIDACTQ